MTQNEKSLLDEARALVPVIKELIPMANQLREAHRRFNEKYGKTLNLHELFKVTLEDTETKEVKEKVTKYLMQYTDEQIQLLMSIMYTGRDVGDRDMGEFEDEDEDGDQYQEEHEDEEETVTPIEYLGYMYRQAKSEKKEIAIQRMLEKSPLVEYLQNGIRCLELV